MSRIEYCLTLLLCLPASPALADPAGEVFGEAWTAGTAIDRFALDDRATASEQRRWLDARIRVGGRYDFGDLSLEAELDAINGQVLGDRTAIGTVRGTDSFVRRRDRLDGLYAVTPRALMLRYETSVGVVLAGQQTFGWGLGLLANDGRTFAEFGAPMRGNTVTRVAFGTKPFARLGVSDWLARTEVLVAADLVYRDDNAELLRGDLAGGGVLAIRWRSDDLSLGLFESVRGQRDRADPDDPGGERRTLTVLVSDAFVDWTVLRAGSGRLVVQSEVALVLGTTDRVYVAETVADGAAVTSFGAVGRLVYEDGDWLHARIEAGLASGDDDSRDDVVRRFTFHSDYQVGLVLFDQVLPMMSARAVDRINDPELSRNPPASSRLLVNQGAVVNARYLYPVVRFRVASPLELRAAYLFAQSDGDFADPYLSGTAGGGFNLGFDGSSTGRRTLGHEVLLGARTNLDLEPIELDAVVEGAVFVPGAALKALGIDTTYFGRVGLGARW